MASGSVTIPIPIWLRARLLFQYGVGLGRSRSARLITNSVYTWVSEWVSEWHICISEFPQQTRFYASRKSFSCSLVKILSKKSASTERVSSQNNTPNGALFSQKLGDFAYFCDSVNQIWTRCKASLSCVIHIKISFHVWNLVKLKTITKLFVSLRWF